MNSATLKTAIRYNFEDDDMKTMLTIQSTIHDHIDEPYRFNVISDDDESIDMWRGYIRNGDITDERHAFACHDELYEFADEVYEVDNIAANTNRRQVK